MPTIHILKVTLRHVTPPVWRRIAIRSDADLEDAAHALICGMGWEGSHLYQFETPDGTDYGIPDDEFDDDDELLDQANYTISAVLPSVGATLRFDYDFGDGWEHDVVADGIDELDPTIVYPVCLAGAQACPPEDCGGPSGYLELLDAIADPKHEQHREVAQWIGGAFNPAAFDVDAATEWMHAAPFADDDGW